MDVEKRNLPLFCLLDILFTRGHHGLNQLNFRVTICYCSKMH